MKQWEEKTIKFRTKEIYYRTAGKGPALVFLHAYLGSSEVMLSLASLFQKSFMVICPDLPGHGQSECVAETHTMGLMADSVQYILETENIETANFCGHSMGGYVALAFLKKYPKYCQSLVLLNSNPFSDTEEKRRQREREISIIRAHRKNLLLYSSGQQYFAHKPKLLLQHEKSFLYRIESQTSSVGMIAALKGMSVRENFLSLIQKPTLPLLWIMGEIEMANFHHTSFNIEGINLQENICVIKGAGHMSFLEEEEMVYSVLNRFFNNPISFNCLHRGII
jgi:pimeloyl-ACP methyl ester carboxylesterase